MSSAPLTAADKAARLRNIEKYMSRQQQRQRQQPPPLQQQQQQQQAASLQRVTPVRPQGPRRAAPPLDGLKAARTGVPQAAPKRVVPKQVGRGRPRVAATSPSRDRTKSPGVSESIARLKEAKEKQASRSPPRQRPQSGVQSAAQSGAQPALGVQRRAPTPNRRTQTRQNAPVRAAAAAALRGQKGPQGAPVVAPQARAGTETHTAGSETPAAERMRELRKQLVRLKATRPAVGALNQAGQARPPGAGNERRPPTPQRSGGQPQAARKPPALAPAPAPAPAAEPAPAAASQVAPGQRRNLLEQVPPVPAPKPPARQAPRQPERPDAYRGLTLELESPGSSPGSIPVRRTGKRSVKRTISFAQQGPSVEYTDLAITPGARAFSLTLTDSL